MSHALHMLDAAGDTSNINPIRRSNNIRLRYICSRDSHANAQLINLKKRYISLHLNKES